MRLIAVIDPGLSRYAAAMARLGDGNARSLMSTALAKGGEAARSEMVATEARQTNLPTGTLERALRGEMLGDLTYRVRSQGGNIRLKHFHAKEVAGGVTADPWGRRTYAAGAFITSGRPGARYAAPRLNGHVYERVDKASRGWGGKIRLVRSGLFIPKEMTTGATLAVFERAAVRVGGEVAARLGAALP